MPAVEKVSEEETISSMIGRSNLSTESNDADDGLSSIHRQKSKRIDAGGNES